MLSKKSSKNHPKINFRIFKTFWIVKQTGQSINFKMYEQFMKARYRAIYEEQMRQKEIPTEGNYHQIIFLSYLYGISGEVLDDVLNEKGYLRRALYFTCIIFLPFFIKFLHNFLSNFDKFRILYDILVQIKNWKYAKKVWNYGIWFA